MSLRDVVEKFVVFERKSDPVNAAVGPSRRAAPVSPPAVPPSPIVSLPARPGPVLVEDENGRIALAALYARAAIPAAPFTAEQALETLSSLPVELPLETRRQALKGVLQAMGKTLGTTPEAVVEDARRKVGALEAAIEGIGRQVATFSVAAESEIAALQEQILERRKAIEAARENERELSGKCRAEADRLAVVLQFFGAEKRTIGKDR